MRPSSMQYEQVQYSLLISVQFQLHILLDEFLHPEALLLKLRLHSFHSHLQRHAVSLGGAILVQLSLETCYLLLQQDPSLRQQRVLLFQFL